MATVMDRYIGHERYTSAKLCRQFKVARRRKPLMKLKVSETRNLKVAIAWAMRGT